MEEEELFYKRYERHFKSHNISLKTLDSRNEKIDCEEVVKTEYGYVSISSVTELSSDIVVKHLPDMEYEEDSHYYSLSGDNFLGCKSKDARSLALSLSFSRITPNFG